MVDGVVHLASYPLYQFENTFGNWAGGRGTNLLDGDTTFYDICQNRDDRVMAVSPPPPLHAPSVSLIKEEGSGAQESQLRQLLSSYREIKFAGLCGQKNQL